MTRNLDNNEWAFANSISDAVVALLNARKDEMPSRPDQLLAGVLLGLLALMRTAPDEGQPPSFKRLKFAAEECLRSMTSNTPVRWKEER